MVEPVERAPVEPVARSCYLMPSTPATPSTPASYIEGAADGGNVTLYTAGVVLSSNDHKDRAAREQSS